SMRNFNRLRISSSKREAIPISFELNVRFSKNTAALAALIAHTSGSVLSHTRTSRASSLRREPLQSGHNVYPRYLDRKTLTWSLYFLVSSQSKKPFTPSNPFLPCRMTFCCSRVSWRKGTVVGMPACLLKRSSSFCAHSYCGFIHG